MMRGEYYKMEYEAWDEGTVDLTLEQEAAYLRLCHQMYRRGGEIPNSTRLLRSLFRCQHNKATALLRALVAAGKIVVTEQGTLSNQKVTKVLVDREQVSSSRRVSGQSGGSRSGVSRRKSLNGHGPPEAFASPIEERREEESTSSLRSEASVSPDARTLLFRNGLSELAALTGRPETKLRGVLGKWLRDADDDALRILALIAKAKQDRPADPIAWIEGHFRRKPDPPRRDQFGRRVNRGA
jgi:uncharacterized protein YdaU (DUF1376 family)